MLYFKHLKYSISSLFFLSIVVIWAYFRLKVLTSFSEVISYAGVTEVGARNLTNPDVGMQPCGTNCGIWNVQTRLSIFFGDFATTAIPSAWIWEGEEWILICPLCDMPTVQRRRSTFVFQVQMYGEVAVHPWPESGERIFSSQSRQQGDDWGCACYERRPEAAGAATPSGFAGLKETELEKERKEGAQVT